MKDGITYRTHRIGDRGLRSLARRNQTTALEGSDENNKYSAIGKVVVEKRIPYLEVGRDWVRKERERSASEPPVEPLIPPESFGQEPRKPMLEPWELPERIPIKKGDRIRFMIKGCLPYLLSRDYEVFSTTS